MLGELNGSFRGLDYLIAAEGCRSPNVHYTKLPAASAV